MASSVITTNGRNLTLHRLYTETPTDTAPTVFKIGTGTTTADESDTDLTTTITGWNAGGDTKDFVSGYPQFDTTNKEVTVRGFISSTQANGNTISEVGEFNTDGTPKMFSHDVFTGISKTNTQEIALIWVHKCSN